jgi:uncharacterized membrane protein YbhN (UPF0104 family)
MGFLKTWQFWGRVGCAAVTVGALALIFHRLRLHVLLEAFRTIHWVWFAAAIVLYGLLFLPAALRWHLVLKLTGNAVSPGVTSRLTLIGHFFYTVLFGSVGGDSAKAVLYSKWYRFPLAQILATAPLDRLLGFLGMAVFTMAAFGIAALSGGLKAVGKITVIKPGLPWLAAILLIIPAVWLWKRRVGRDSLLSKFVSAFRSGAHSLAMAPRVTAIGATCGFLVQASLCGVIALNLVALDHAPIPWVRLLWTLPVIVAISCAPISIGGIGTRDGAALFLLGLYGIPESIAIATSLLTLAAISFWAIVGGLLFLKEAGSKPGRKEGTASTPLPQTPSLLSP